ncbi:MAG: hypothetical protein HY900_29630 [Deltaproteobacteria bacterium]|nr:hypothetical protein [Deltaproteobacteria bacterium]
MAQSKLGFCDLVESLRARLAETPSRAEKTKLDELCVCLEKVGCDPARVEEVLPELADLQEKLDSCETKMTQDVCRIYRSKLNGVLAACSPR